MKQEDKDLLLLDLCSRLPYGVMCATTDNDGSLPNIWEIVKADMLNEDFFLIHDSYEASRTVDVKEVRPYLFPLSSMTEEQKIECFKGTDIELDEHNEIWSIFPISNSDIVLTNLNNWLKVINWLNKNHFDYRNFIPKGLAIDCTNLNIY